MKSEHLLLITVRVILLYIQKIFDIEVNSELKSF